MALRRGGTGYQDGDCSQLSQEQQQSMETEKTPKNIGYTDHFVLNISDSVDEWRSEIEPRYIGTTAGEVGAQIVHDVDKLMANYATKRQETRANSSKVMHWNPMPSLKHSGSKIPNTSKYREEFIMITRQHKAKNSTICHWYKILYIGVILLYALLLGMSTMLGWYDLSKPWVYTILTLRYAFTIIFAIDVVIQLSMKGLSNFFGEAEAVFDVILLLFEIVTLIYFTIMVSRHCDFEGGTNSTCKVILNQIRMFSCISLLRMYKVCMASQPLMNLSKGIFMSIRSLMWTAVFVFMVVYSCGICTTWIFTGSDDEIMLDFWGTLPRSMYTLFTILTLEGWNDISNSTAVHYPYSKLFFVIFVCFATLAVMNVVTGIILDTFLTANEKLTGERSSKRRCDRQIQATQVLVDALKDYGKQPVGIVGNPLATDRYPDDEALALYSQNGVEQQEKVKQMDPSSDTRDTYMNCTPVRTWNVVKLRDRIGERLKKVLSKTKLKMPYVNACGITAGEDMQVSHYSRQCGPVMSGGNIEGYNCAADVAPCLQNLNGQDEECAPNYRQHSYGNKQTERSTILEEHMDEEDLEAAANPSYEVHADQSEQHIPYGNQEKGCTIGNQTNQAIRLTRRENMHRILSDASMETHKHMGGASHANAMIDMTQADPYMILSDPVIQRALRLAGVPMYQAYEVLNLYYVNQLYRLTVQEFVEACDRLTGNASSKDILTFELAFSRRLDIVETALAQMGDKLDAIIDSITKIRA
ncbi:hypothetical protein X943_001583 [Babesia divergens]|uniref:Ion transport domain-containing protein n=1 Tax=Babesia divergens TaxID=32595 RepID=A0AAD9G710_BABDI|nr:hypothetical protein X943_001583 [Babesia divergens]